jgi:hypothetical protein
MTASRPQRKKLPFLLPCGVDPNLVEPIRHNPGSWQIERCADSGRKNIACQVEKHSSNSKGLPVKLNRSALAGLDGRGNEQWPFP